MAPGNAREIATTSQTMPVARGLAINFCQLLVATHDLPLISRLRHRIITLNEGRLAGATAE